MSGIDHTAATESTDESIQVVEFSLGEETYCVPIDRVAELVHMDGLTTLPNAEDHVEGVMDLRGQTTTIVDPRPLLDVDEPGPRKRVLIFADEDGTLGTVGWVVDEVREVRTVPPEDVDRSSVDDQDVVDAVVKTEGFTVMLDVDAVNE